MIIYLLFEGDYHRRRTIAVTDDVKLIAKTYSELLSKGESVDIEIWKDNHVIGYFHEYEKVESKVKKALTKKAMNIK